MVEETLMVEHEVAIERIGGRLGVARLEGARHEGRRTVSDHPPDAVLGQPRGAARFEQRVGGVGDVASGVDQRAVQVKDDETKWLMADG
jgi:hypothetical protein